MKARVLQGITWLVVAGLALAVCVPSASAAPDAAPAGAPAAAEKLVTVMGPDMPLKTIFSRLASAAGVTIDVAASVSGSMDVSLSNVKLESALDLVCSSAGLVWEKKSGSGYTVRPKVSVPRPDAPAASRPAPARAEETAQPAAAKAEEKAPTARQLTPAQLQLVLQGVPNLKAANLLEQWRHRTVASPRIYTPGGVPEPAGWRPSVVMTPYGPYYPAPPNVTYYMPDGSVWTGYPYPYPNAQVR